MSHHLLAFHSSQDAVAIIRRELAQHIQALVAAAAIPVTKAGQELPGGAGLDTVSLMNYVSDGIAEGFWDIETRLVEAIRLEELIEESHK